jgi:arsenate reductase
LLICFSNISDVQEYVRFFLTKNEYSNVFFAQINSMIQVLHNPRCGKSRESIALIEATGKPFEIIKYLDNPLSVSDLKALIQKLEITPIDLIRQKESIWIEKYKGRNLSNTEIIQAIAEYPILMERPIVIHGSKAVIGRPTENIKKIIYSF